MAQDGTLTAEQAQAWGMTIDEVMIAAFAKSVVYVQHQFPSLTPPEQFEKAKVETRTFLLQAATALDRAEHRLRDFAQSVGMTPPKTH